MEEDPAGALQEYAALLANAPNGASAPLRYRLALCAEFLGESDRASSEYEKLVRENSNSRIAVAAQLGQARIWHASNRRLAARRAVWHLLLAGRMKADKPPQLRAQCAHQLGQMLAFRTTDSAQGDLLSDLAIVDPQLGQSVQQALRWIVAESAPVVSDNGDIGRTDNVDDVPVRLTQQLGSRAAETFLETNLPQMPVTAVVELLTGKAGLKAVWSPVAHDRVGGHTVQVATPETTLAILLDGICDPMELAWVESNGTIRIHTRAELSVEVIEKSDLEVAERMLRRATTAFPDHALADDAYWALGNISVRRGQHETATRQYEQFLRQFSLSVSCVGVRFNLAKTKLCLGLRDEAMEHFYQVVDEAPTDRLEPIANLYLGRLYLENDQAKRATRPLMRSLKRANDDVSRATAAITLASAHLLLDDSRAANRILMTHRAAFTREVHSDQAALLAALARHQVASTPTHLEKQSWPLLDAVTHLDGTEFFGAHGFVILAEAYGRLGLFEAMLSTLQGGLEIVPRGGLRSRMLYELAEYHYDAGEVAACKDLLISLAIEGDDAWANLAKLRVAKVIADEGEEEQCLAICRELLEDDSETAERNEVLKTMGRVFERLGRHRAAALCFAGTEPFVSTTRQE